MLRLGELAEILGLASVIMVMGLIDDLKDLNWRLRLGIQFGCATVLAATGIRVTLFGPFTHPILGGAVTVFWIVALTNSFNMLDNMDGLAASVGLIAASLFCGAQVAVEDLFAPAVLLVVVGALGGFLVAQPRAGAAVHGGCRQQLPRVPARRHDGRRHVHTSPDTRPTACSHRCWSWRYRSTT